MKRMAILVGLFLVGTSHAQETALSQIYYGGLESYFSLNEKRVIRPGNRRFIYRFDPRSDEVSEFYRSEFGQLKVRLSPSQEHIASIQLGGGGGMYVNNLIILDRQGNLFRQIDEDVHRYAWSPDGEQIAFIVGEYRETGIGFSPEKVMVYDLATRATRRIARTGKDIIWAAFDDKIYIYGWKRDISGGGRRMVFRYDPATGSVEETDYRDIYFSPGGTYYYMADRERGGGNVLISRADNRVITLPGNLLINPRRANWNWLSDDTIVFNSNYAPSPGTLIYRIDPGTVLHETRESLRKIIPSQQGFPGRVFTLTEEIELPAQGQIKRKLIKW